MFDLGRTFLQSTERSPNAEAIVEGELRLTYAQSLLRIAAVAQGLKAAGAGQEDRLLVVLRNRWEMATLHWACQFAGIIVTPLNWRAKADEVEYCARDAGAKIVIYEAVSHDAASRAARACGVPTISVGDAEPGTIRFEDWSGGGSSPTCASAHDVSVMLYTSGTTGKPKGVPRTHGAERAAALAHVAQNLYRGGERTLGVMPLYHTMGVRTLLSMALVDGCLVCMPRFDAAHALELIGRERVTHLYLAPTLYHDLISHAGFAAEKVASVRKLGFAGAPMSNALLDKVDAAFKPDLFVNHYGSSEIYTFTVNPDARRKPGSAGEAGLNARIRVVKLDGKTPDQIASVREEGQIIADLQGDEAFERYWNRPDADEKSLREGWYFTLDMGYFDEDAELFVTGRVDDMIISGGENISPMEIESVLSLHRNVDEAAVAGLKDERWGQKVVAFVKCRGSVDAAALDDHCRSSNMMSFKRPREYVFVQEIPKSPVGKILRRKLVAGDYEVDP